MVITEADGAASEARRVAAELQETLADDAVAVHAPVEPSEVAELWRWRGGVGFAILAQRGGAYSEDIAVPLDRLRDVERETLAIGERHGVPSLSFGHAGDGNIHSTFLFSAGDAEEERRADAACHELFDLALRLGGTVTGEHGIGWLKRGQLEHQLGATGYDLHRGSRTSSTRRACSTRARSVEPAVSHDALRRRARQGLAAGAERAGARAHFRAMGIDPARLDGPIVGVASTWTGTMPCNLNQRELAARVSDGVVAAGGVALEFNTIAVSDNQSQATPGMRASLISREVIADSIELMVHAHDFDALVCLVGCDKTVPAALMALARVDKPAVVLYSGPMRAGRLHGREVTIQTVWEAVGAEERGLIPRAELDELERFACPGAGTCAGHFTANTMAVALDCLGITVLGDGLIPRTSSKRRATPPSVPDRSQRRCRRPPARSSTVGPS